MRPIPTAMAKLLKMSDELREIAQRPDLFKLDEKLLLDVNALSERFDQLVVRVNRVKAKQK